MPQNDAMQAWGGESLSQVLLGALILILADRLYLCATCIAKMPPGGREAQRCRCSKLEAVSNRIVYLSCESTWRWAESTRGLPQVGFQEADSGIETQNAGGIIGSALGISTCGGQKEAGVGRGRSLFGCDAI